MLGALEGLPAVSRQALRREGMARDAATSQFVEALTLRRRAVAKRHDIAARQCGPPEHPARQGPPRETAGA